jgi:hypothetical protein
MVMVHLRYHNTVSSTTKPVPDPVTNFTSSFNPNADIILNWTPTFKFYSVFQLQNIKL